MLVAAIAFSPCSSHALVTNLPVLPRGHRRDQGIGSGKESNRSRSWTSFLAWPECLLQSPRCVFLNRGNHSLQIPVGHVPYPSKRCRT